MITFQAINSIIVTASHVALHFRAVVLFVTINMQNYMFFIYRTSITRLSVGITVKDEVFL